MEEQLAPWEKVELALLRAEHQKRFQVMIEYVKEKVGKGMEYQNSVVKVVISETGVYYELTDLPEEFSGAVSEEFERHFITPKAAIALLNKVVEATKVATYDNTRHLSVIVLYTRRGIVDRKNCFVYEFRDEELTGQAPLQVGKFQPGVMPLFFKFKVDADYAEELLGIDRGVVFCMSNAGDRHLLVKIPYRGDQVMDLANLPVSNTIN